MKDGCTQENCLEEGFSNEMTAGGGGKEVDASRRC